MSSENLGRVVAFFVLMAGLANAQTTQGGITGTIRDEKGAEISAAKVRVTSPGTGLTRETTTAGNGLYHVVGLPTGSYAVTAEAPGFATAKAADVRVGVDQIRTLDFTLRVGARSETVNVESSAELTQTETSKLGEIS